MSPYIPPQLLSDEDGDNLSGENDESVDPTSASLNSDREENQSSTNDEDDDKDGVSETQDYPKIDGAAELDPDNPKDLAEVRKKTNKKKRAYPKLYTNLEDPSDLQLACDSLTEMAKLGSGDSQDDDTSQSDDLDEGLSLQVQKARAAKKC